MGEIFNRKCDVPSMNEKAVNTKCFAPSKDGGGTKHEMLCAFYG